MKPVLPPFLFLFLFMQQPLFSQTALQLKHTDQGVEIRMGEQILTALIFPPNLKKPVLYPVFTTGGQEVTRGFPIHPRPGDRVDHPHHVGIWFNHGDVNGLDFWNNSEAIAPEKREQFGTIFLREVQSVKEKKHQGIVKTLSEWVTPDGTVLLEEKTTYIFFAEADYWTVDRITELTVKTDSVTFTDSKEGMYGIRLRQEMELPSVKPARRIGSDGKVTEKPVTENLTTSGTYLTSEGNTDESAWGKTARWVRLSGNIEGKTASVILMDHPQNPYFPAQWHARDYGLFAINNLGRNAYDKQTPLIEYTLAHKQTATFRHRLIVHEGTFPDTVTIESWYEKFTQP
ncbi:MAG: PmoA family protein [Bacteroidia bacterium]|nr:PmoA family protein [Bacteroidia bacterium]